MRSWALRLLWASAGAAWLFWLGYEDRSLRPALGLAALITLAASLNWIQRRRNRTADEYRWGLKLVIGAGIGGIVPLLASLLILVKVSLHSHNPADFSAADLAAVLERWPIWAAIGFLAGGGWALLATSGRPHSVDQVDPVEYNEGGRRRGK